jgi:putative glutamine amidotransferase
MATSTGQVGNLIRPPLIGITTHGPHDPYRSALDTLLVGIVAGIERAGGLPVLIPYGMAMEVVYATVERLDGLLLSGGGDIAPHYYGLETHPKVEAIDPWRDEVELALVRKVVAEQTPFFGICRGMQALNVALGGAIHPEISEVPEVDRHTFYPDYPFDRLSHPVQIAEESQLARVMGVLLVQVNSLHHQALDRLAPPLQAVAIAPDGMIEAVEVRHHPFALAVQWHPEALPNEASSQALFAAFVQASQRR